MFTSENTFNFSCAGNHTIPLLPTVGLVGLLNMAGFCSRYDTC